MAIEFLPEENGSDGASDAGNDAAPAAEPRMDAPADHSAELSAERGAGESDDLDSLLADFDKAVAQQHQAEQSGPSDSELELLLRQAEQETQWNSERDPFQLRHAESLVELGKRDSPLNELKGTIDHLQRQIAEQNFRQYQAAELEAFKSLVGEAQERLQGADVEPDFAERYLLSEAARDPQLVAAFQAQFFQRPGPLERAQIEAQIQAHGENLARQAQQITDLRARALAEQNIRAEMVRLYQTAFPDPQALKADGARYVQNVLNKLVKASVRPPRIDPDATADRHMIVQAIKSAGGRVGNDPPPAFGRTDQRDFNRFTEEHYGFTAV